MLLDDMGCQAGVEPSKLATVMNPNESKYSKSYDMIKLGIDAHAKWYYVARLRRFSVLIELVREGLQDRARCHLSK